MGTDLIEATDSRVAEVFIDGIPSPVDFSAWILCPNGWNSFRNTPF